MKHLEDYIADPKIAVAISNTGAALVATAIDTTGFSRARFIFTYNTGAATTATISGDIGIYKATTSGATFSLIAGSVQAQVSSGVVSGASVINIVDVPTDSAYEWLKVSGSLSQTAMYHTAVVELYNGISHPATSTANEVVTV